ncbi:MAG: D-serine ammonia-lyase [Chitinophagales bacterium]|nr:D-serine ammonia-lyase [Chitinophagales bacterium]
MTLNNIEQWTQKYPLLKNIIQLNPITWINPSRKKMNEVNSLPLSYKDILQVEKLWERFAPYLVKVFPELKSSNGFIESPLRSIENLKLKLNEYFDNEVQGKLFLKCDNELPIAGSIKARGGFYEVLYYAEQLALKNDILKDDDNYEIFATEKFKQFFQQYSIGVGSTGNLGLSIGIISAQLGFKVSVYMSADAKQWKKDLLRSKGVIVHEFDGDFSEAITKGREATKANPKGYFVDDENSKYLFLGYSLAALRLKKQLEEQNIFIDKEHPLFVYSPCGVGGSAGGIAFGLRQVFGDSAHSFFVEPIHSPSVLIGLITGENEKICVQDLGIDNKTEADGLAVGRPSAFATAISNLLISGIYTIEDEGLYRLLYLLGKTESILVEPSATAGLIGAYRINKTNYISENNINPSLITHIAWATGGDLVPKDDMEEFYFKGKELYFETLDAME